MGVPPEEIGRRTRIQLAWPTEFHDQVEDLELDIHWCKKKEAVVIVTPKAVFEYSPPRGKSP